LGDIHVQQFGYCVGMPHNVVDLDCTLSRMGSLVSDQPYSRL